MLFDARRDAADRGAAVPGRRLARLRLHPLARRSRRSSPAATSSPTPPAGRGRSPPRRSATACASSARAPGRSTSSGSRPGPLAAELRAGIIGAMKLVRMKPGHGDVLLAEGDPEVAEDEERLIEEFRRQLDLGMWAAVPTDDRGQRRGGDGARLLRGPARRRAGRLLPAGRGRLMRGRRAEQRARELLRSVGRRARLRDLRGARVHRSVAGRNPRLRLPGLPAPADRRLRHRDRRAADRVLRRLPTTAASACRRRRRRPRQVDGAAGRRARPDRGGEHAPPRPPGRPRHVRRDLARLRELGTRAS